MRRLLAGLVLSLLWLTARGEDCYQVGPGDAEVTFEIEQAGAAFTGAFERFEGTVCMENEMVARVSGSVAPGSVASGLPELDAALRGPALFAVDEHPRATFDGTRVERRGDGYVVSGTLTVKGVSRPVAVPFEVVETSDGYRVRGAFAIRRLDFGIGTGEWADTTWVSDETTLRFSGRFGPRQ